MSHIIDAAHTLAAAAHFTQVDKAGEPYLGHPLRVARYATSLGRLLFPSMNQEDIESVALLHDVLEDNPAFTEAYLRDADMNTQVIHAVNALTHSGTETRAMYIDRIIEAGPLAVLVKAADLLDNTDPRRLAELDENTADRLLAKYATDLVRIRTALLDYAAQAN